MICHDNKWIFIHCQKCGGESIELALSGKADRGFGGDKYEGTPEKHLCKTGYIERYGKDIWNEYFTFSFVRNPWDRMISWIFYRDKRYNLYNGNLTKDILINEITMKGKGAQYVDLLGLSNHNSTPIKFIGRFENIQNDFEFVCQKLNTSNVTLPHVNKTIHKHYTEYYDEETKQLVANKYAKDIEYFGYEFGK